MSICDITSSFGPSWRRVHVKMCARECCARAHRESPCRTPNGVKRDSPALETQLCAQNASLQFAKRPSAYAHRESCAAVTADIAPRTQPRVDFSVGASVRPRISGAVPFFSGSKCASAHRKSRVALACAATPQWRSARTRVHPRTQNCPHRPACDYRRAHRLGASPAQTRVPACESVGTFTCALGSTCM